jgi:hypothetical protein
MLANLAIEETTRDLLAEQEIREATVGPLFYLLNRAAR